VAAIVGWFVWIVVAAVAVRFVVVVGLTTDVVLEVAEAAEAELAPVIWS
jgi:hypothetical protein